jgi:alpha-1,2-mannosyltransferase
VKQVQALAELFKDHPEYRSGDKKIHLTMMGGTRNQEDKDRADGLRQLATGLGVSVSPSTWSVTPADEQDNVELLENAPYGEIVTRLGEASIGLNTMQDEHFGINVVEFMVRHFSPPFLDLFERLMVGCWTDTYRTLLCWSTIGYRRSS